MATSHPITTTPQTDARSPQPFLHTPSEISDLNNNDLYVLLSFAKRTLVTRGALPTSPILQPIPYDIFDNAKYEQIACLCLKPRYSGNPNDLIPTLNVIHIRHQNEAWYSATFLLQGNASIDLVQNFSQVEKSAVEARCKHW